LDEDRVVGALKTFVGNVMEMGVKLAGDLEDGAPRDQNDE